MASPGGRVAHALLSITDQNTPYCDELGHANGLPDAKLLNR